MELRRAVDALSGARYWGLLPTLIERKNTLLQDAHDVEERVRAAQRGVKLFKDRLGKVTVVEGAGQYEQGSLVRSIRGVAERFSELAASLRAVAGLGDGGSDAAGQSERAMQSDSADDSPSDRTEDVGDVETCDCAELAMQLCAARELWQLEL